MALLGFLKSEKGPADQQPGIFEVEEPLLEIVKAAEKELEKIFSFFRDSPEMLRLVKQSIKRYLHYTFPFPASGSYHHSDPGGLFRHGLQVASYMLERCYSRLPKELASQEAELHLESFRKKHIYWFFAFLTGLLHDVGKVADYMVLLNVNPRFGSGQIIWNPYREDLVQFIERAHYTFDKESIEKLDIGPRYNNLGMEHSIQSIVIGLSFLRLLQTEEETEWLWRLMLNEFIKTLFHVHYSARRRSSVFLEALEEADHRSVQMERIRYSDVEIHQLIGFFYRYLLARGEKFNSKEGEFFYLRRVNPLTRKKESVIALTEEAFEDILQQIYQEQEIFANKHEMLFLLRENRLLSAEFFTSRSFKTISLYFEGGKEAHFTGLVVLVPSRLAKKIAADAIENVEIEISD